MQLISKSVSSRLKPFLQYLLVESHEKELESRILLKLVREKYQLFMNQKFTDCTLNSEKHKPQKGHEKTVESATR